MRWFPVLLLAYLAVGLQAGLSGQVSILGAGPNLGLLAIVFIAANGPHEPALLACAIVGGMQDLATQQAPGLYALSYGIVGWFVSQTRGVVYREHPLTQMVLTLFGGLVTAALLYLHGRIVQPRISLRLLLTTAAYTMALAPLILGPLQRMAVAFGFDPTQKGFGRRGYARKHV